MTDLDPAQLPEALRGESYHPIYFRRTTERAYSIIRIVKYDPVTHNSTQEVVEGICAVSPRGKENYNFCKLRLAAGSQWDYRGGDMPIWEQRWSDAANLEGRIYDPITELCPQCDGPLICPPGEYLCSKCGG